MRFSLLSHRIPLINSMETSDFATHFNNLLLLIFSHLEENSVKAQMSDTRTIYISRNFLREIKSPRMHFRIKLLEIGKINIYLKRRP